MDEFASALVLLLLAAILLTGMALGWRARRRRQAGIPRPASPPEDLGAPSVSFTALHVATTLADQPLERLAVAGLGFRAAATLEVHSSGLVLALTGEPPAYVPATDLVSVGRATWTIDRVVEAEGLLVLQWRLGGTGLDTYVRLRDGSDPGTALAAVQALLPSTPLTSAESE